jgi:hypothetical protein
MSTGDITRSIDMTKVAERLGDQVGRLTQQNAMLTIALEDAIGAVQELQRENEELKRAINPKAYEGTVDEKKVK